MKNSDENETTTEIISIPVVFKTQQSNEPKITIASKPNLKLNEMGSRLVELSKSNVDLNFPKQTIDRQDSTNSSRRVSNSETQTESNDVKISNAKSDKDMRYESYSVSPVSSIMSQSDKSSQFNRNEYSKEQATYSPNTINELYLYDHEIDQFIKDLEDNKQPQQFTNLGSNNLYIDSVLDKGVVVSPVSSISSNSTALSSNTSAQQSYYNSSQIREQSSSSTHKTENHSMSSHAEASYHSTNNSISNQVQYYIDQKGSAQHNIDFNRQNSNTAPSRQHSLDSNLNDGDRKYISVYVPSLHDSTPNKAVNSNEMLIIKSDENVKPNTDKQSSYFEVIYTDPKTPEISPKPTKPAFNHSLSEQSVKPIESSINSGNVVIKPVVNNPENVIYGENAGLGAVKLTVYYDELRSRLSITIHQAQNLKNLDKSKKTVSDPYCRIYLLPDDKQKTLKRKTRVVKVFN